MLYGGKQGGAADSDRWSRDVTTKPRPEGEEEIVPVRSRGERAWHDEEVGEDSSCPVLQIYVSVSYSTRSKCSKNTVHSF